VTQDCLLRAHCRPPAVGPRDSTTVYYGAFQTFHALCTDCRLRPIVPRERACTLHRKTGQSSGGRCGGSEHARPLPSGARGGGAVDSLHFVPFVVQMFRSPRFSCSLACGGRGLSKAAALSRRFAARRPKRRSDRERVGLSVRRSSLSGDVFK
jgi:hypothetical protein